MAESLKSVNHPQFTMLRGEEYCFFKDQVMQQEISQNLEANVSCPNPETGSDICNIQVKRMQPNAVHRLG